MNSHQTPSGLSYNPDGTVYDRVVTPLLKQHEEASFIGTTQDLYTLYSRDFPKYDLPPDLPKWDFSKPTISAHQEMAREKSSITFDQFEAHLGKPEFFDMVTKFVRQTPGLIMAGGYVVKTYMDLHGVISNPTLLTQGNNYRDIDLFLTGPAAKSVESANKIVIELESLFIEYCTSNQNIVDRHRCSMGRTPNCINFFTPNSAAMRGGKIAQIIIRRYHHPSEVLHSFDLGSCQLAYDGEDVFTTSAGLLAIRMKINIIDMKRRRRTYEKRLAKYFCRGFGIVFPNLSPASLKQSEIRTSYFRILVDSSALYTKPRFQTEVVSVIGEEYSGLIASYRSQFSVSATTKHNIVNYIRQKSFRVTPHYLIRIAASQINSQVKLLSGDDINSHSICCDLRKINEAGIIQDMLYSRNLVNYINDDRLTAINLGDMKMYLTPEINRMIVDLILIPNLPHDFKAKIIEKIEALRDEIIIELPKITVPLKWKSSGEEKDLNASFGMEPVPIHDWYGDYYVPSGWNPSEAKYYPKETRNQIKTTMLIRGRERTGMSILPMELIFHIFNYLIPS